MFISIGRNPAPTILILLVSYYYLYTYPIHLLVSFYSTFSSSQSYAYFSAIGPIGFNLRLATHYCTGFENILTEAPLSG